MVHVEVTLQGNFLETASKTVALEDWQRWFETWLEILAPEFSPIEAYELSLQLVSDPTIEELNAGYRGHAQATDVLSFAAIDDTPLPIEILNCIPFNLGDLVISVETAQKQCTIHGHTLREELAWLCSHGLLHLLGWDHPDEIQLRRMLAMQQKLLSEIGLALEASEYFSEVAATSTSPEPFSANQRSDF